MLWSEAFLATLVFSNNVVAITVLLVSFYHKLYHRAQLPSLISQYELLNLQQAIKFAPLLLVFDCLCLIVSAGLLVFGQWVWSSVILCAIFSAYSALLVFSHYRNLNLSDCGCSLVSQKSEAGVTAVLARNALILIGLLVGTLNPGSQGIMSFSLAILSVLFSALCVIALMGLEVLVGNAKKLKTLKVSHG